MNSGIYQVYLLLMKWLQYVMQLMNALLGKILIDMHNHVAGENIGKFGKFTAIRQYFMYQYFPHPLFVL